ncbi:hypothetical protein M0R45_019257 [Rubus argutus]|uniref:Uncharacterized protein n=1 Tax=Rubus argutus TaxID=59490 RepID=A0AAW1X7A5_RUBAR
MATETPRCKAGGGMSDGGGLEKRTGLGRFGSQQTLRETAMDVVWAKHGSRTRAAGAASTAELLGREAHGKARQNLGSRIVMWCHGRLTRQ